MVMVSMLASGVVDRMAIVVVNVWWLDLQLPMQSVPITTDVVGSTLAQGEYNIM